MLDTIYRVETPEGVGLSLRSAGVFARSMAWLVDFGIRFGVLWVASMFLAFMGEAGQGIYLVVVFLLLWFYPIVFEVLWDGQTIGKRVMSIRVVMQRGTPVTWLPSITRNFLRTIDFMPLMYATGLIVSLSDRYNRRIGDLAAGTLVVYVEKTNQQSNAPDVLPLNIPMPLNVHEQSAIVNFAERASSLTPERQEELCTILQPLTQARGPLAVQRVLGYANALLGRRPS
jgi:uncharacterized RDD family membrane protein YckC